MHPKCSHKASLVLHQGHELSGEGVQWAILLPVVPFRTEDLELISATREVSIETRGGDRLLRTVIWIVVDEENVYVRSVRGEAGRWYQRALANREVALHVGTIRIPAQATPASDAESVGRASEAFRRKYRKGSSLNAMVRPEVLGTTLRLEPPIS